MTELPAARRKRWASEDAERLASPDSETVFDRGERLSQRSAEIVRERPREPATPETGDQRDKREADEDEIAREVNSN